MQTPPHVPRHGPLHAPPQAPAPAGDDPLPGFDDRAAPDRFCDLVLTGGVTSSIAYPGAIFVLGAVFRFNGIGGSSSGGGTAALAAAAEYRRRHGSAEGFRQMLAGTAEVAQYFQGRTGLQWLFQPDPGQERLFGVLVPGLASPSHKIGQLLLGLLRCYGPWAVWPLALVGSLVYLAGAALPGLGTAGFLDCVGAVALALAAGLLTAGAVLFDDLRRLAANDHGLCSGQRRLPGAPREPITPWLHGLIQQVAGRAPGEPPLSFADLHSAPGGPGSTPDDGPAASARSIDLRMFAADVTRGLPLQLPLAEPEPRAQTASLPGDEPEALDRDALYFLPQELAPLFPPDVMDHLLAVSPPVPPGRLCVAPGGAAPLSDFRRLPGRDLPVVVAARMTVSFPLLFRAVPLWALSWPDAAAGVDADAAGENMGRQPELPQLRRCLLSDGALVSAFPMQLFDSLLPAWPTFGIALHPLAEADAKPLGADEVGRVQVPTQADDRGPERWGTPSRLPRSACDLFTLVDAMLSTLMNWNDNTVRRMAGVRDRVAHVSLKPGVGGLNILMSSQQIRQLARLGGEAGRALLQRFVLDLDPSGQARGWSEHRWTRFVLLAQSLAGACTGAGASLSWSASHAPHAQPLPLQIERARQHAPLAGRRQRRATLLAHEAAALHGLLQALQAAEPALRRAGSAAPDAPGPATELRQRPPL